MKNIKLWLWKYRTWVPYVLLVILISIIISWHYAIILEYLIEWASFRTILTTTVLALWIIWALAVKDTRWAMWGGILLLIVIAIPSLLKIISWSYLSPENGQRPNGIQTEIKLLGGIAGLVLLYLWWRRIKAMDKTNKIQAEGQVTERFTRAIDQLGKLDHEGKPVLEIRLGGIYALEQIAKEYPDTYHD